MYIAPEVLSGSYDERCDTWSLGVIMYLLLCGYPPFFGGDTKSIFKSIIRGQYSLEGPEWAKVSKEAKDLIHGFLQTDPNTRITLK